MTLHDRVAALPGGRRSLAVSRLRNSVLTVLHKAFRNSGIESQADLAKRLKVRRSAVNQVFRGDGNVRIKTLAEYLYEMGYEVDITLVKAGELRSAAIQNRVPTPAFPVASVSASATYGTYPLEASHIKSLWTAAYQGSNLLLIGAHAHAFASTNANALFGFNSTKIITSAAPSYSALDMSSVFAPAAAGEAAQ